MDTKVGHGCEGDARKGVKLCMIVVCVVLYEPLICELNQLWRRLCYLVLHCRAVKGQVLANSMGLPWSLLGWEGGFGRTVWFGPAILPGSYILGNGTGKELRISASPLATTTARRR